MNTDPQPILSAIAECGNAQALAALMTPGPWRAINDHEECPDIFYIRSKANNEIAVLYNVKHDRDARAIALVPELVEAFTEVIDAHYGCGLHHIGDGDGITKESADKIRALIAKLESK